MNVLVLNIKKAIFEVVTYFKGPLLLKDPNIMLQSFLLNGWSLLL